MPGKRVQRRPKATRPAPRRKTAPVTTRSGKIGRYPVAGTASAPLKNKTSAAKKRSFHEHACSLIDPFCSAAKNAKWPDGMGIDTMTIQSRGHFTHSTLTTTGRTLVYVRPCLSYDVLQAASADATTFTMSSTLGSTSSTALAAFMKGYRITSAGCIIRNVASATNASGVVTVSKVSDIPAVSTVINNSLVEGVEVCSFALAPGEQCNVIFKPVGALARQFLAPVTVNTNAQNLGWDAVKVESYGGPGTAIPVLDVETYYNIEFLPNLANNILNSMGIPPTPANAKVVDVATRAQVGLTNMFSGTIEQVGSKVVSGVSNALDDIISEGFALLGL